MLIKVIREEINKQTSDVETVTEYYLGDRVRVKSKTMMVDEDIIAIEEFDGFNDDDEEITIRVSNVLLLTKDGQLLEVIR